MIGASEAVARTNRAPIPPRGQTQSTGLSLFRRESRLGANLKLTRTQRARHWQYLAPKLCCPEKLESRAAMAEPPATGRPCRNGSGGAPAVEPKRGPAPPRPGNHRQDGGSHTNLA